MTPRIVRDRVTERIRIDVNGGFVRILREYQIMPEGTWRIDPEAGITFGGEYLDEVLLALHAMVTGSTE